MILLHNSQQMVKNVIVLRSNLFTSCMHTQYYATNFPNEGPLLETSKLELRRKSILGGGGGGGRWGAM